MKKILFASILILSSFLFGCNNNDLDISSNNNEANAYYNNESDLSEYREEIEQLYVELKFNYENTKENKDLDKWDEFKNLFDNKLKSIKEKVLNTNLKYSLENLQDLYTNYDKELRGF